MTEYLQKPDITGLKRALPCSATHIRHAAESVRAVSNERERHVATGTTYSRATTDCSASLSGGGDERIHPWRNLGASINLTVAILGTETNRLPNSEPGDAVVQEYRVGLAISRSRCSNPTRSNAA